MDSKKIKLSTGDVFAIVDPEELDSLLGFKWFLSSRGYAIRSLSASESDTPTTVSMHATINKTPKGMHTDHINQDKLDNRKNNLRTATPSQNGFNRKLNKDNSSGYTGVYWHEKASKWYAGIKVNQVQKHLGTFDTMTEAVVARIKFQHELALQEARADERQAMLGALPKKKNLATDTDEEDIADFGEPHKFCVECGSYEFEGELKCVCVGYNQAVSEMEQVLNNLLWHDKIDADDKTNDKVEG